MEQDRLKANFDKLPREVALLTKSENELKNEMINCIEKGEGFIVNVKNEFKRLRREHHATTEEL